jgi:hypothetical protein
VVAIGGVMAKHAHVGLAECHLRLGDAAAAERHEALAGE